MILTALDHFPEKSIPHLEDICQDENFLFKLKKGRRSKFGDFRYPIHGNLPIITVNADLNPYHFIVTFLHELAHYFVWKNYKSKKTPHGKEWKHAFSELLIYFCDLKIFPEEIESVLRRHAQNPKASSFADVQLLLALNQYNQPSNTRHLGDLEEKTMFRLKNGKTFVKGVKRRSRVICEDVSTRRKYLIHVMAEVYPIQEQSI